MKAAPDAGFSLVNVLVGVGLLGILAAASAAIFGNMFSVNRKLELRGDIEIIRRTLFDAIDCDATIAAAACNSTSAPGGEQAPFLRLQRRSAVAGQPLFLTGPLEADGSARIGEWNVRASCSAAERTLVVRAARPLANGAFARDPMDRLTLLDWRHRRSLLFGSGVGVLPLCFNTQKESIACVKTDEIPAGADGWRHFRFTAAECGGRLPDDTYVGSIAKFEICGQEASVMALQPSETYVTLPTFIGLASLLKKPLPILGPGGAYAWTGGCPAPASSSLVEIIYTKLSH